MCSCASSATRGSRDRVTVANMNEHNMERFNAPASTRSRGLAIEAQTQNKALKRLP